MIAAQSRVRRVLNAANRSTPYVAAGAALCAGAVLLSWWVAARNAPSPTNQPEYQAYKSLEKPPFQPPPFVFSLVWPPLYALLTIAGIRLWNAPDSADKREALKSWTGVQGLIAGWMALRQKRTAMLATSLASLAATTNFLRSAARVDKPSAAMVAPFLAWIGFATLLTGELWRRNLGKSENVDDLARDYPARQRLSERTLPETLSSQMH